MVSVLYFVFLYYDMTMVIQEKNIEEEVIGILRGLGYEYVAGKDLKERSHLREVILEQRMVNALCRINPDMSTSDVQGAVQEIVRKVEECNADNLYSKNKNLYNVLIQGIPIETESGQNRFVRCFDFNTIDANDFLVVNQFSVGYSDGAENRRRVPDIVVFVNGIPLAIVEMKSAVDVNATLEMAHRQVGEQYARDISGLFACNQLVAVSDGVDSKIGTHCSPFQYFADWKRAYDEDEEVRNRGSMETFFEGIFSKSHLLDIVRNFILFSGDENKGKKILCRYYQYYGVRKVEKQVEACVRSSDSDENHKKVGVFWHTQGSGKTLSMIFLLRKILERNNIMCVFLTDRQDLSRQAIEAFSQHSNLNSIMKKADSMRHFNELLQQGGKRIIFAMMHKFDDTVIETNASHDILVIIDEAHRTQYRGYATTMRQKLPNASFLGLTGTPIAFTDRHTVNAFGRVISRYTIDRAVDDGVVVPIGYDTRYVALKIQDEYKRYADRISSAMPLSDVGAKDEKDWNRVLGARERVQKIAKDIVTHFNNHTGTGFKGKALVIVSTRMNAVKMYNAMRDIEECPEIEVVLSGYDDLEIDRRDVSKIEKRFKKENSELKIVIVCDMWLTGFDVPSLQVLYLDKPLKGHNLFQAIARVNRLHSHKQRGLIVDYIGATQDMGSVVAQYTTAMDVEQPFVATDDIVKQLKSNFERVRRMLGVQGSLHQFVEQYKGGATNGLRKLLDRVIDDSVKDDFLRVAYSVLSHYAFLMSLHKEVLTMKDEMRVIESIVAMLRKENNFRPKMYVPFDEMIKADNPISVMSEENIFLPEHIQTVKEEKIANVLFEEAENVVEKSITSIEKINPYIAQSYLEKLENILQKYRDRFQQGGSALHLTDSSAMYDDGVDKFLQDIEVLQGDIRAFHRDIEKSHLSIEENAILSILKDECRDVARDEVAQELANKVRSVLTLDWTEREQVKAQVNIAIKDYLSEQGIAYDESDKITKIILEQVVSVYKDFVPSSDM